jgi:Ca-activated chloride channel family protein
MKFRYADISLFPPDVADRLKLLQQLFSQLLVMTDGDAEQALEILERLAEQHGLFGDDLDMDQLKRQLLRERIISQTPQGTRLTAKGEAFVRSSTLDQIFRGLQFDPGPGQHRTPFTGRGGERQTETRAYRFGDELADIDFNASFHNAFKRTLSTRPTLSEEDLEVYESEQTTSVATCLLLDVSHSMILYGEDRITPAKRVALALAELIKRKYPKDALHIILFGDEAWEVTLKELTYAGVGPYHTNTHMALQMARRILLRKKQANKQVFMITDGKPTALIEGGELSLNSMGLDPRIRAKPLNEAAECRRHNIPITTFMIARDPWLVRFVEDLTRINKGRAFFAGLDQLEQMVFADFLSGRRRKVR